MYLRVALKCLRLHELWEQITSPFTPIHTLVAMTTLQSTTCSSFATIHTLMAQHQEQIVVQYPVSCRGQGSYPSHSNQWTTALHTEPELHPVCLNTGRHVIVRASRQKAGQRNPERIRPDWQVIGEVHSYGHLDANYVNKIQTKWLTSLM